MVLHTGQPWRESPLYHITSYLLVSKTRFPLLGRTLASSRNQPCGASKAVFTCTRVFPDSGAFKGQSRTDRCGYLHTFWNMGCRSLLALGRRPLPHRPAARSPHRPALPTGPLLSQGPPAHSPRLSAVCPHSSLPSHNWPEADIANSMSSLAPHLNQIRSRSSISLTHHSQLPPNPLTVSEPSKPLFQHPQDTGI